MCDCVCDDSCCTVFVNSLLVDESRSTRGQDKFALNIFILVIFLLGPLSHVNQFSCDAFYWRCFAESVQALRTIFISAEQLFLWFYKSRLSALDFPANRPRVCPVFGFAVCWELLD